MTSKPTTPSTVDTKRGHDRPVVAVLGQTSSVTGEDGSVHLGEHGTAVALDTLPGGWVR